MIGEHQGCLTRDTLPGTSWKTLCWEDTGLEVGNTAILSHSRQGFLTPRLGCGHSGLLASPVPVGIRAI